MTPVLHLDEVTFRRDGKQIIDGISLTVGAGEHWALLGPNGAGKTTLLEAAQQFDFPLERLMFEVTEVERIEDPSHLKRIFDEYSKRGFTTAIDDFGAGYSGLNLLASFQPHVIKLDMALTRNIHADVVRQAIVAGIVQVAVRLNIEVIAEGIETIAERDVLTELGIRYMQGYLYARPGFERLVEPDFP